jgi:hypothetical protein
MGKARKLFGRTEAERAVREMFGYGLEEVQGLKAVVTPDNLRAYAATYHQPCAFKPGDLVVGAKGGDEDSGGTFALVLEVRADPMFVASGADDSWTSNFWGVRLDMRILHARPEDGMIHAHWVESWKFQLWADPLTAPVGHPPTKPFEED